ncbi:MAG: protein translocase subunit SecF [Methanomicrobiales archaeon]|nr:protein translocase subunit SecF [Methanomicrobiales archaeon]
MVEFKYNINKFTLWQLAAGPIIILLLCLVFLSITTISTGFPMKPGVDFAGGTEVTLSRVYTEEEVLSQFSSFPLQTVQGQILRFNPMSDEQYNELTQNLSTFDRDATINRIDPIFGQNLQTLAVYALIASFIGMSIVVFVSFRTFVPSGAVILSAFADIVMTAATMNILGIALSLGTTAALLMLIGYSVDSDILLTTRVIKRKGKIEEKFSGAFRTGIVMTSTTMAAVAAMWVVSILGSIQVIAEIASVLFIGLIFDIFNTWLTNAGLLKWYTEKRGEK